jgi:23S rRNA-/tRNA-specific pseudouridylate synthase
MLYGGSPSVRLHLHAAEIIFRNPGTGETITLESISYK